MTYKFQHGLYIISFNQPEHLRQRSTTEDYWGGLKMLFLQQMMDYVGANGQKYSEIRLIDMNIDSKPTTKAIYIPTALFLHRLQSVLAVDDLLRSGVAGAPSG